MKACDQNVIGLVRLSFLLTFLCVPNAQGASFVETANMGTGRFVGTTILLSNGQVLAAGGGVNPTLENVASAELYDPAVGLWSSAGSIAGSAKEILSGEHAVNFEANTNSSSR